MIHIKQSSNKDVHEAEKKRPGLWLPWASPIAHVDPVRFIEHCDPGLGPSEIFLTIII